MVLHVIQQRTAQGWEDVHADNNRARARSVLRDYRANDPATPARMIERRERGAIVARWGSVLRIYDAGPDLADRYTVIPPRWAGPGYHYSRAPGSPRWAAIAAGPCPFHPQGFGQHIGADAGPHLGRRIAWADLPADVQRFARQSFPSFAPAV